MRWQVGEGTIFVGEWNENYEGWMVDVKTVPEPNRTALIDIMNKYAPRKNMSAIFEV